MTAPDTVDAPRVERSLRRAAAPRPATEPEAVAAMRAVPPLATLATIGALLDLAWNRIGVRLVDPNDRGLWIPLVEHGRFVRNLAVIAGLLAAASALSSLVRVPSPLASPWKSLFVRLTIAGLAGLYLPGVAIALVAPREHVPSLLVALGLLSGSALVAVLASSTLSLRRVAPAWPSLLAGLTALLAMVGLLVASLRTIVPVVGVLGLVCRHGAELGWLLTPLTLLADPELRVSARRPRWIVAALTGLAVLLLAMALQSALHDGSARIAYGAFRVSMLPAEATWLYGLPIGISIALALVHLLWTEHRSLGLALLLWIAAGLAPRTPAGTLYEVLAAALFARAALVAHPEGRARLVPYARDAHPAD